MNIKALISRMTVDQKIGQIITFEFIGNRIRPDSYDKLEGLHCGGLRITPHINEAIPYDKRFDAAFMEKQQLAPHAEPDVYAAVIRDLQSIARERPLGIPLHISIDQEGDFSCDFARGGVNLAPSAMGVSATGNRKLAFDVYRAVGRQLRSIGATMVHSPVLDVNNNPNNPEISTRSFGDDPKTVIAFAGACMKGFMAAGIVPTAKHFPGRGASAVDLHHALDEDPRTLADYEKGEILPYARLITQGLPAIMMSHQMCRAFDPKKPSTVTPTTYRYIRDVLKFDGVITTDAMGMKGVLDLYEGLGHACAEAAASGADLVLAKCHPALEGEVFDWIKKYVKDGRIIEADLDRKIERVLRMKASQGLFKSYFSPRKAVRVIRAARVIAPIRKAAEKSAILVRDEAHLLPLRKDTKVLVIEPIYREWQSKGFDIHYQPGMLSLFMEKRSRNVTLLSTDIRVSKYEEEKALALAATHDITVVNTFFWRGCPTNRELIKKLLAQGTRVIQVATAPFDEVCTVAEVKTLLITWGQVPECQRSAANILFGKTRSKGKWPLKHYKIRGIK